MKRLLTIITLIIIGIGLAGLNQVYAWGQRDGTGFYGGGVLNTSSQMDYSQLDPAIKEKLDTFYANTEDIRLKMVVKRDEKRVLIRSANPNPEALSRVEGELVDLRKAMNTKAEEAGVTEYLCPTDAPVELRKGGRNLRTVN